MTSPFNPPELPSADEPAAVAEVLDADDADQVVPVGPPVTYREILAVLLLIAAADLTIYRGQGFSGYAALFVVAPLLFLAGSPRPRFGRGFFLVGAMLVLLAAKLAWNGSSLAVASGFALLVAFTMILAGLCPYVLETLVFASQTVLAGYEGLRQYRRSSTRINPTITRSAWLNYGLPVAAFVVFGLLFVVANPNLESFFGETVDRVLNAIRQWVLEFSPDWQETLFWVGVWWIAVGLLRPVVTRSLLGEGPSRQETTPASEPAQATLYVPFRNTLVTVIVLFAVYLGFEFKTLWFRVFPEGFYYSGYAHEGAAWLTVALALATLVLSLIFRGAVLGDPRLPRLRRMAWLWSLENLLLAVAVYHRLMIYIGFNGMTWMRTVGLFGMSCVVAGFLLVVWKIVHNRDFLWLVRHHLWALALAVYLFALTPVDALVHHYNVRRIMAGDPAPSVQISVHPIDLAAVPVLLPLVDARDPVIRDGVRAMLANRQAEAEARFREHQRQGWTAWQLSDRVVLDQLRASSGSWAEYRDPVKRDAALRRFHDYAYAWY